MNYLTIEQSISLLPSEFKNIVKCPGRRAIYSSSMGNFYFSGSKDYGYKHKTWWYSIDPEVIKSERIAFIVLAADVKGDERTSLFLLRVIAILDVRQNVTMKI